MELIAKIEKPAAIWDGETVKFRNEPFKEIEEIVKSARDLKNYTKNRGNTFFHSNEKKINGMYIKINNKEILEIYEIQIDIDDISSIAIRYKNSIQTSPIIEKCNHMFYKTSKYVPKDIIGKPLYILFKNPLKDVSKQTNWLIKNDNEVVLVNIYNSNRILTIKKLKYTEDLFKLIFQKIPNPIIIFDNKDNKYSTSNELFNRMRIIWKINDVENKTMEDIFGQQISYKIDGSHNGKIEKIEIEKRIYEFVVMKQREYTVIIIIDITDKTLLEEFNNLRMHFFENVNHEIKTSMNCILSTVNLILDTNLSVEQKEYVNIISDCNASIINIMNDIVDYTNIKLGAFELNINAFNLRVELGEIIEDTIRKIDNTNIEFKLNIDDNIPIYLMGDVVRIKQIIYNLLSNAIKFTEAGKIIFEIYKVKNTSPKNGGCNKIIFSVKDTGHGIPGDKQSDIFTLFYQIDRKHKYRGIGLGLTLCKELCEIMGGKIWFESKLNAGSTFYFCLQLPELQDNLDQMEELSEPLFRDKKLYVKKDNDELVKYLTKIGFKEAADERQADLTIDGSKIKHASEVIYDEKTPNNIELIKILANIFSPLRGSKFEYKTNNDLSILIGEDNSRTQQTILNILHKNGYFNIDIATNAEETLGKIFSKKRYDLLLVDLHLPHINGYEIAKIIKSKIENKPFIVALIESKNKTIEKEYKKYGIDAYIFKPVDEEVMKSLLKILNKYRD